MEQAISKQLLNLLQSADNSDLSAIEREIQEKSKELAALKQLHQLISTKINGKNDQKKAKSGPALGLERRKSIVRYLAQAGSKKPAEICAELKIPESAIKNLLNHSWFTYTGQGVHITPIARQEVL